MLQLSRQDEDMLNGKYGEAVAKAMEIIVSIAEALDAKRLIDITSAHVSGVSILNIGRWGAELIEDFARRGARVRVGNATVNPIGFDLNGIIPAQEEEWRLQVRVLRSLESMGFKNILSCAPYDYGNRPRAGEHIAWGESSAVLYANSVLGAYTNREGGIVALAAALTGRIYEWGMHLPEERVPRIVVDARGVELDDLMAGLLGAYIGLEVENVPLLLVDKVPSELAIRGLLAAAGAWGNHALIYIPGRTPGYEDVVGRVTRRVRVSTRDLERIAEEAGGYADDSVDALFIGCPHVPPSYIEFILEAVGKCGGSRKPFYVSTCGCVDKRLVAKAAERNIYVLSGTCLVVSALERLGVKRIATNSLKAAFYLPRRHKVSVSLASIRELVRIACEAKS